MLSYYNHPKFLVLLLFGFLSALPLPLTGSSLTAWLAEEKVSHALIGLLALFEIPFALKPFFWPLVNRVSIPYLTSWLGRRRSWTLVSFLGAAFSLILAALLSPVPNLIVFYIILAAVSAFSGCIYLLGVAYEIESLTAQQYGEGSACVIFGYRLGLVTGGAGSLLLAHQYSWQFAYFAISALMIVGVFILLFAGEPPYIDPKPEVPSKLLGCSWFRKIFGIIVEDVLLPAIALLKRKQWQGVLLFLLFYRISDGLVEAMMNPFYIDIGFSKAEIATVAKIIGMIATVSGALIAGVVSNIIGLEKSLILFSFIHAGRFLFYIALSLVGAQLELFIVAELFHHFSSGMIITVFIAALWRLTTPGQAAPQYALLWSAISLKTKCLAFLGGLLANSLSWDSFFIVALITALCASLLPLGLTDLRKPQIIR